MKREAFAKGGQFFEIQVCGYGSFAVIKVRKIITKKVDDGTTAEIRNIIVIATGAIYAGNITQILDRTRA